MLPTKRERELRNSIANNIIKKAIGKAKVKRKFQKNDETIRLDT